MTWWVHPSSASRHLVLRASAGEILPDALAAKLRGERVACGWLRASGVVADVELRAYDGDLGTLGSTRRIAGTVQVLALEGSIGLAQGEPSMSLRALLARETDRGLETLAGEIVSARTVALEVLVTALDDLALERALDASAGVWLLGAADGRGGAEPAARPTPEPRRHADTEKAPPPAWSSALEASENVDTRARPAASPSAPTVGPAVIPQRPPRPGVDLDTPFPEPGDVVDHFAFGRADVVKSDGDRLHLKVYKDGRIREIALEMLRVSRLPDADDGKRRFKLERRM
jgi:predicted DNA-binding protein with PD1-like motif